MSSPQTKLSLSDRIDSLASNRKKSHNYGVSSSEGCKCGDVYERWPEGGRGKYTRKNGNVYIGDMRNGIISRGDSYVGTRSKERNHHRVLKKVAIEKSMDELCKRARLLKLQPQSRTSNDAKISSSSSSSSSNVSDILLENGAQYMQQGVLRREKRLLPGERISEGHQSYDLVLRLQLGIRYSVARIAPIPAKELRETDFGSCACLRMRFPKAGSKTTPAHRSEDFGWKDYRPMVFRNLREMFKIDAADYMMSICGTDNNLRELCSPGKSGSTFFLSQDNRFIIKTLRKAELKVLLRMLLRYHQHVRRYENTLLVKFFGLHRIRASGGEKFRFVVMGNVFCTELRIHRRFDLKGSSLGRLAEKVDINENSILKDLDLKGCFHLETSWRDALLQQIEIDSKFLESKNIMDYSLLLGVHYRPPKHRFFVDGLRIVSEDESIEDEISPPGPVVLVPHSSDDCSSIVGLHSRGSRLRASSMAGDEEVDLLLPGTARLQIQLGVNMPARVEHREDDAETYDVVLYLGIIDILQEYNMRKKIEHAYKSVQFDSVSISAVDPSFYSRRFLEFIRKVFPANSAAD